MENKKYKMVTSPDGEQHYVPIDYEPDWNECLYCGLYYDLNEHEALDEYCPDCQDKLFGCDHD